MQMPGKVSKVAQWRGHGGLGVQPPLSSRTTYGIRPKPVKKFVVEPTPTPDLKHVRQLGVLPLLSVEELMWRNVAYVGHLKYCVQIRQPARLLFI
jgi:hypothetical protein